MDNAQETRHWLRHVLEGLGLLALLLLLVLGGTLVWGLVAGTADAAGLGDVAAERAGWVAVAAWTLLLVLARRAWRGRGGPRRRAGWPPAPPPDKRLPGYPGDGPGAYTVQ